MKNYQKPLGTKLTAGAIFAVYLSIGAYYDWTVISHQGKDINIFSVVILLIIIAMPALILVNALRWRLSLTDSGIIVRSLIKNRELRYNEIKGYVLKEKTILIVPEDDAAQVITVSNSFENVNEFMAWLKAKYEEIDSAAVKEDGSPADAPDAELEDKIALAKNVVYTAHAVCILIVTLVFSWRGEYPIVSALCALIPFIYFIIYHYHSDVVTIAPDRDSPYPSVGFAMFIPSVALMASTFKVHYLDSGQFYQYAAYGAALFIMIYLRSYFKSNAKGKEQLFSSCFLLIVTGGLYGYTFSSWINRQYDKSEEQVYYARVMDKYTRHGRSTYHYIVISPWGPQKHMGEISVGDDYDNYEIGDRAFIGLHQGALGISWYMMSREKDE